MLPTSAFAIPSTRSYPIHDESHARNALARVSQFGTPAQKAAVRSAVASRYPGIGGESKSKKKKGRK
jgi:hypothetical protein